MSTEVLPPDLEAWATGFARSLLAARELEAHPDWDLSLVTVGNKEPVGEPLPEAMVIFRDDGGPQKSLVSWSRSLGVSVLAGSRRYDAPARDLTLLLMGALIDQGLPLLARPCPVASVDGSFGPYRVEEALDRTRMYFTVEYTVFGIPAAVAG